MWLVGIGIILIALHVVGVNVKKLLKVIGAFVLIALIALSITIGTDYYRDQKNSAWEKERDAWIAKQPSCDGSGSFSGWVMCHYEVKEEYEHKHPKPYPEN